MKLNLRPFIMIALTAVLGREALGADYCLAVRGNGELEPAHWGAISRVVEQLGMPSAQAGGSSGSITMFLMEGIALNPLIKTGDSAENASFLIKSLQGFAEGLTQTQEWKDFFKFYQGAKLVKQTSWAQQQKALIDQAAQMGPAQARAFITQNAGVLKSEYAVGVRMGLIAPQNYAPLSAALMTLQGSGLSDQQTAQNLAIAQFYSGELYNAVNTFGSFNAATDDNLFFRPGVIDFASLADQFGRIAEFYSMSSATSGEQSQWQSFMSSCAVGSRGLSWEQIVAAKPACVTQLNGLMTLHFSQTPPTNFTSHAVGAVIPSFPITTVLTGSADQEAEAALAQYPKALSHTFGQSFKISDTNAIRFGYWGAPATLARAAANLDPSDEKSRRFLALGASDWKTVLGLSPAEPGLSPLKPFTSNGQRYVSAGGWADLSPVLFLKASGCANVVYVTRVGGESVFGQGVAKRLFGYDRAWNLLDSKTSTKINNMGDASDLSSLWSKLYNLANPTSSYRHSVDSADAVVCTNWDSHEITEGVGPMFDDAYAAPFYVPAQSPLKNLLQPPGLVDPSARAADGSPKFAGCY